MEYKLLSEVSVYRKDRIGSDKVNKENYISTENMLSNRGGVENATTVASAKSFPAYKKGDILFFLPLQPIHHWNSHLLELHTIFF